MALPLAARVDAPDVAAVAVADMAVARATGADRHIVSVMATARRHDIIFLVLNSRLLCVLCFIIFLPFNS
jgi:hypothetical protein